MKIYFTILISLILIIKCHAQFIEAKPLEQLPLLVEGYPSPSKDGSKLVFHSNRMGNNDIYMVSLETNELKQLTHHELNDRTPSLSPDGQHIAFVSTRDGNYDIFIMNTDGSKMKNLTLDKESKDIHPYWSPDGQRIIFNSTNKSDTYDLYSMKIDGTDRIRLRNFGEATHAQYSPLGDYIAFRKFFRTNESSNSDIMLLDLNSGDETRITSHSAFDNHPSWSPDGKTLIFMSDRVSGKRTEMSLYTYSLETKEIKSVTKHKSGVSDLTPVFKSKNTILFSKKQIDGTIRIMELKLVYARE